MISRLFLIGVVGALGVSLPDGPEWGSGSARAQAEATAHVCCRHAVAFEPIVVVEDPSDSIADELNRRNDGLDIPDAPIVSVVSSPREEYAPVPSGDSVESKLMAELCQFVEDAESHGPAGDPEVDALFAENRVWAEPAVEPVAALFAENRVWAEPAADLSPAREPRPSFEPIDVAADAPSLADELNRASDGQSPAPDTDRSIGNAIRLTRNAALAWMNVLTNTMTDSDSSR